MSSIPAISTARAVAAGGSQAGADPSVGEAGGTSFSVPPGSISSGLVPSGNVNNPTQKSTLPKINENKPQSTEIKIGLPSLLPEGTSEEIAQLKKDITEVLASSDVGSTESNASPMEGAADALAKIIAKLNAFDSVNGSQFSEYVTQALADQSTIGGDIIAATSASEAAMETLRLVGTILQIPIPRPSVPLDLRSARSGMTGTTENAFLTTTAPSSNAITGSAPPAPLSLQAIFIGMKTRLAGATEIGGSTHNEALGKFSSLSSPSLDGSLISGTQVTQSASGNSPLINGPSTLTNLQDLRSSVLRQIMDADLPRPLQNGGVTRLELTPIGLGRLEIEVETLPSSALRILVRADNPLVLDALRLDRSDLEAALTGQDHTGGEHRPQAFDISSFDGERLGEGDIFQESDSPSNAANRQTPTGSPSQSLKYGPLTIDIFA